MKQFSARRVRLVAAGTAVAVAAGLLLAFSGTDSPGSNELRPTSAARAAASDDQPASPTTTQSATTNTAAAAASHPLEVVVDPSVQPAVVEVEGFADGSPARPVGRVVTADGTVTDVVLDEVQLLVPDDATLNAFVARWDGIVTDITDPDADGMRAALVHVDVERADPDALPADLLELEPDHGGTMRVSSDRVQRLYAAIAADAVAHGTIVSPNTLAVDDAIVDGTTKEWDGFGDPNAFAWNIIRDGAAIDSGVGHAWQLMEATGTLENRVRIMIVDGGFSSNPDFPDVTTLRLAKWGDTSRTSGGYHGTDVVLAAMAKVDNEFGTAGPAGPVAELVAVAKYVDDYKTLRKTLDMVREHDPDIISSSYHTTHVAFRDTTEALKDWYYRRMRDNGAILFASAGNDGKNVDDGLCGPGNCDEKKTFLPCESKYVVCVGGVDAGTAKWDDGSNYGIVDNNKSVEIYGPWCTWAKKRNDAWIDFTMTSVCGTSFATPFVAGVATLVMAANPDLSDDEVRNILMDSAHSGMPLADRTRAGSSRWVDAFEAVRRALGVEVKLPAITIEKPDAGKVFGINDWVDLRATATDFVGRPLSIVWTGDVAGALGTSGSGATNTVSLAPGTHEIIAWTTDFMGNAAHAKVTIELRDSPPGVDDRVARTRHDSSPGRHVVVRSDDEGPRHVRFGSRRPGVLGSASPGNRRTAVECDRPPARGRRQRVRAGRLRDRRDRERRAEPGRGGQFVHDRTARPRCAEGVPRQAGLRIHHGRRPPGEGDRVRGQGPRPHRRLARRHAAEVDGDEPRADPGAVRRQRRPRRAVRRRNARRRHRGGGELLRVHSLVGPRQRGDPDRVEDHPRSLGCQRLDDKGGALDRHRLRGAVVLARRTGVNISRSARGIDAGSEFGPDGLAVGVGVDTHCARELADEVQSVAAGSAGAPIPAQRAARGVPLRGPLGPDVPRSEGRSGPGRCLRRARRCGPSSRRRLR